MIFLFLITQALAGIFGEDSRVEAYLQSSSAQLLRARATPALVRTEALSLVGDGSYLTKPRTGADLRLCEDVRFADQPFVANCSASLIAEDLILTAAHCIDISGPTVCGNFKIVFDFAQGEDLQRFRADQVYECKKIEHYQFNPRDMKEDLAVIRLDRAVTDRAPIELDLRVPKTGEELELLGYPLGLPLKLVAEGKVTSLQPDTMAFRHDLDTFSCNSGGPVFSKEGKQIGVLVRGTTANLRTRAGERCQEWGQAKSTDWAEANTLTHLRERFSQLSVP